MLSDASSYMNEQLYQSMVEELPGNFFKYLNLTTEIEIDILYKKNGYINNVYGLVTIKSKSSRLPRKFFLQLNKKSILENVIDRCNHYGIKPITCPTIYKSYNFLKNFLIN